MQTTTAAVDACLARLDADADDDSRAIRTLCVEFRKDAVASEIYRMWHEGETSAEHAGSIAVRLLRASSANPESLVALMTLFETVPQMVRPIVASLSEADVKAFVRRSKDVREVWLLLLWLDVVGDNTTYAVKREVVRMADARDEWMRAVAKALCARLWGAERRLSYERAKSKCEKGSRLYASTMCALTYVARYKRTGDAERLNKLRKELTPVFKAYGSHAKADMDRSNLFTIFLNF